MAMMNVQFSSQSLCGATNFMIAIPNDASPAANAGNPHYDRPPKMLILLHGFTGTYTDWFRDSRAVQIASRLNLALVCPQGGNNFYLDGPETGRKYASFVGKELVEYVGRTFGLSTRREDVFIGGFSMGGFGAVHTALAFPEQFSKVLSFSAALIHHNVEKMQPGFQDGLANYAYYRMVFGDPAALPESPNNPEFLLKQLKAQGKPIPGIFQCVGTEDFLYGENQIFRSFLTEQGVPFTYREAGGGHDMDTVAKFLEEAMRFLVEG